MDLLELKEQCEQCKKCPLGEIRTNVVFGSGNEKASVMLIGEAPGQSEDREGMPFIGRAGKLLDSMLLALGTRREDIYIANILKCRPPKNRDPLPAEEDMCLPWLRSQFDIIKPKIVVCLGRIAAKRMISPAFKITKDHGTVYEKDGVSIMATFHPAAVLRNPNYKPLVLQDLEKAFSITE